MDVRNRNIKEILTFLGKYLHGKDEALRLALLCFFTKGHLLVEDMPGLGKTTLAIGLAKTLGMSFGRIQCTNDLLPSDITGLSIYNKKEGTFSFKKGPIFYNIVLVDEINRATPKTQSALLEAMGEKQVTVEGNTYNLLKPFFVIATQNPLEQYGTFPLPESQMDRFMMKISVGYPTREAELEILSGGSRRSEMYDIDPVLTNEEIMDMQDIIKDKIHISDKIYNFLLDISSATRNSEYLRAGLSTRASLSLMRLAKANAFFCDRDYVVPEDITSISKYVITHRVLFRPEFESADKHSVIQEIISSVPRPHDI